MASVAHASLVVLAGIAAAGVLCVAYGVAVERRWYRLRRYRLPALPPDAPPVAIMHLSDLHFYGGGQGKPRFLASLPTPDVLVVTGDFLGEPAAVERVVEALRPLRGRLASYFVLGSNDYYAPRMLNYFAYFRWRRRHRTGIRGRATDLVAQLAADGWTQVTNTKASLEAGDLRLEVAGLDDPHIERHDLCAAVRTERHALGMALVHSPDPAPELAALGYDLILAGHTHGGQVRMPFVGALVTNGTTPTRLCMGLSRVGHAWLHVSPGMGTSKFAPFRFLCRPEATILELVPAQERPRQPEPETASSKARS